MTDISNSVDQVVEQEVGGCRFCLNDSTTDKNPMIRPCDCKGTSGNIHLKCLQDWLNSKCKVQRLSIFQENYIFRKSQCEICKTTYPD
jgi:E3 ubiquitin-protein ligase DOA10